MSRPKGPFEIVSVLPVEDASSLTYRVKSQAELFSRAAKESDLVAVDLPPSQQTTAPLPADPVSGRWLPRPSGRGDDLDEFQSGLNDRIRILAASVERRVEIVMRAP